MVPGVPVFVRVRALNALGVSLPVDSSAAVVPFGAPAAPRGASTHLGVATQRIGASGETDTAQNVDLAWAQPPFGGPHGPFGSPINSYDVKLATGGRVDEIQRITALVTPPNASSATASAGSFRLSFVARNAFTGRFPTTSAAIAAARDAGTEQCISFDAPARFVQKQLQALPGIKVGGVRVSRSSYGPASGFDSSRSDTPVETVWMVTFSGASVSGDVPMLAAVESF